MATAQPPTTKRNISPDEVDSSDPADGDTGLKKQKLEPTPDEVQPDSTEPRDPAGAGSSDDSDLSEVDLEDASEGDSDDLDGSGKVQADGEEFDESHSGDPVEVRSCIMCMTFHCGLAVSREMRTIRTGRPQETTQRRSSR